MSRPTVRVMNGVIRKLRTLRGISQEKLLERVVFSVAQLSRIENGGNTTLDSVKKIAKALGVHPNRLLEPEFQDEEEDEEEETVMLVVVVPEDLYDRDPEKAALLVAQQLIKHGKSVKKFKVEYCSIKITFTAGRSDAIAILDAIRKGSLREFGVTSGRVLSLDGDLLAAVEAEVPYRQPSPPNISPENAVEMPIAMLLKKAPGPLQEEASRGWWNRVFEILRHQAMRVAMKRIGPYGFQDSEDISQEVLFRVWKILGRNDDTTLTGNLTKLTEYVAVDAARAAIRYSSIQKRQPPGGVRQLQDIPEEELADPNATVPSVLAQRNEFLLLVYQYAEEIFTPRERVIFHAWLDDESTDSTAERLEVTRSNIIQIRYRMFERLRHHFEDRWPF